jgi:hypothetical protein
LTNTLLRSNSIVEPRVIFSFSNVYSDAEIAAVSIAIPKTSRKHRNPSGSGGSGAKLKRRIGASRTSAAAGVAAAEPLAPKLKLVNVEVESGIELIECQLETARHQSVSFKFSRFTDRPDDIAANMVSLPLPIGTW